MASKWGRVEDEWPGRRPWLFRTCNDEEEEEDEGHHDSWHCLAAVVDSASAEEDSGGGGEHEDGEDEHDVVHANVAADNNSRDVNVDPNDIEEDAEHDGGDEAEVVDNDRRFVAVTKHAVSFRKIQMDDRLRLSFVWRTSRRKTVPVRVLSSSWWLCRVVACFFRPSCCRWFPGSHPIY